MKVITARKLESICSEQSRNLQGLLPELIKRLIIDSVSDLSSIRIPDNDDIWAPGFDGIVECNEGSLYVNSGKSVWEFGNVNDPLKKLNEDYSKRTNNPLGIETAETTYYAVIPKIWAYDNQGCSITQWTSEKKDWKEVKVYDATILCDWINMCPAVAAWFIEKVSEDFKLDFSTVSKAWIDFSNMTSPPFSTGLFTNEREEDTKDLYRLIQQKRIIKVKSKISLDAYGFCLSSLLLSDDYKNKVIVVNDEQTYKRISEFCKNAIILIRPTHIDSFSTNKSIMCYNTEAVSIDPDIELHPLKKKSYLSALKDMRIAENELEDYYFHTHGELFALIRRIPGSSNLI